ncbi:MAG: NAD(+)/NADH kinase [Tissierellia bacterium]|nr:NAD(+)/NADH kinase [Tissierellia bacterium]
MRYVNIISNSNFESRKVTGKLIKLLKQNGFTPTTDFREDGELTICIGGDGAFIKAVNRTGFSPIPIIGINTGHLGFYQEIRPVNLNDFIKKYLEGNYFTEKLHLVGAEVFTKSRNFILHAINEIVLKSQHSKVIHLNVFVERNHLEKFSGDGILVSTPSGSTGYNFSSGGSIVYPTMEAIQITPLAPITSSAYRSLPNSMVIPGEFITTLVPEKRYTNSSLFVVDGMEYTYRNVKKVNFRIADKKINRIVLDRDNYWNNLKSKFL